MKRVLLLVAALLLCTVMFGCGMVEEDEGPKEKVFEISDYGMVLKTDDSFELSDSGTNFNLQITDGNSYVSVMAYKTVDLAEGQTPKSIYDYHITDMFSRRENVTVIDEEESGVYAGRKVTRTRYSAELNGNKNWYDIYLVDFESEHTFAWVLVTSTPSHLESKGEYYKNVVLNLRMAEQTEEQQ